MNTKLYLLVLFFLMGMVQKTFAQGPNYVPTEEDGIEALLKKYETSLRFQENKGQWGNNAVLFRGNNQQASFQFTPKGVSIGILEAEAEAEAEKSKKNPPNRLNRKERYQRDRSQQTRDGFVWNLNFLDGNSNPEIMGKHPDVGNIN